MQIGLTLDPGSATPCPEQAGVSQAKATANLSATAMSAARTFPIDRLSLALTRRRQRWLHAAPEVRLWDGLALGLVAVAAILVLLTFRDYGVTWDEDVHN